MEPPSLSLKERSKELNKNSMNITPIKQSLSTESFLIDILSNQYILILGNTVMLDNEYAQGDVNKWLLCEINKAFGKKYKSFNVVDRQEIFKVLSPFQEEYTIDKLNKELVSFLEWTNFRMVFTTTVDPFAELLMNKIWGKGKYDVVVYGEESFLRLCNNIIDSWEKDFYRYDRPTLVYVFGRPKYFSETEGDTKVRFLHNDETAIEYMCDWMLEMKRNKSFSGFVNSKKILSLGCNFDNWYFRFFWHIMTRIESKNKAPQGVIGIKLDDNIPSEKRLGQYLKDNTYVHISQTPTEFLKEYNGKLQRNKELVKEIISNQRRDGQIFISYNSKNKYTATDLFLKLSRRGYNVWIDKVRLLVENDFDSSIEEGITKAQVVILLLSPEIAEDLVNESFKNSYYYKEWLIAKGALGGNKHLKLIKPLVINGYNPKETYHTEIFTKEMGKLSAISYSDCDGFQQLLIAIDEIQQKNKDQKHKDEEKQ